MTLVEDAKEPLKQAKDAIRMGTKHPATCRGYAKDYNPEFLRQMVKPHVESFNFFLENGIDAILREIRPVVFTLSGMNIPIAISLKRLEIGTP